MAGKKVQEPLKVYAEAQLQVISTDDPLGMQPVVVTIKQLMDDALEAKRAFDAVCRAMDKEREEFTKEINELKEKLKHADRNCQEAIRDSSIVRSQLDKVEDILSVIVDLNKRARY